MMDFRTFQTCGALGLCLLLAACGTTSEPSGQRPAASTQEQGGYYKIGQPYRIKGTWYYPKEDYSYDETGIASWYGAAFHGGKTANGEMYNKNELTAAHQTLPMPSLARVTNLENGRSIVVRINDRGPFSGARIIDMSQRAAQLLGFERQGTAKVRVQVLADESRAIAEAMQTYGGSAAMGAAMPPQMTGGQPPRHDIEPVDMAGFTEPPVQAQQLAAVPLPASSSQPSLAGKGPLPPMPTLATVKPVATYTQVPVSGANQIYIQAGAFSSRENADRIAQSLQAVGQPKIVQANVKGALFYRVRLGPIATVPQADAMLKKVVKAGSRDARIIVD